MLTIVLRAIIIYLVVLLLYRLMGKRQLGEMQPFELVLTLIIADLATIPMAEVSVPVLHGIIPLFTLVVLHYVLTFFSKISNKFASFLSGKPVIVINPEGIDSNALKNLDISVDDVFEAIRGCGFFKIEQIQYAIMETNGKMSVLPKSQFAPVTAQDMKLKPSKSTIPISVIAEGKVNKDNLKTAGMEEAELEKLMKKAGVKNVKDVLVMTVDKSGAVYVQKFNEKYQTLQTKPLGQVQE